MIRWSISLFSIFAASGCQYVGAGVRGSGVAKTETRDVGTFDEVEFAGVGQLEITVGKPSPLTITGDDNLLPLIQTSLQGHRLTIRPEKAMEPKTKLVFTVGTADIKLLNCSGAAKAIVAGVKNESLKIELSGAGSIQVNGQTGRFDLSISGAGTADADELLAKEVIAEISGAGSADVNATDRLKADISGAGTIRYKGEPKVEQTISGVGSVKKKP